MASIELIDTTVRDGNQSLWGATGLKTAMMLQIAPVMDRVGFSTIDFTTSTHMAVAVRYQRKSMGADPSHARGDAHYAVEFPDDRHAVHILGGRQS